MKKCRRCLKEKDFCFFTPERRNKDKCDSYCKDCRAELRRLYRINNPEKARQTTKIEYARYKKDKQEKSKNRHRVRKLIILNYYSKQTLSCSKCGFSDIRALSIDHINGGGLKHRREIGLNGGSGFYSWLIKNNFPEGFQVLCMNCQYIKKESNKECYVKKTT
jgi:hypothetical protein